VTKFNIQNSQVEQLNNSGDNLKLTSSSGNNAVSQKGSAVQTDGAKSKVMVGTPKEGFWSTAIAKLTTCWKWLTGQPA